MKQVTHSLSETQHLAKEFAASLFPGSVVALFGDLGSGKTTFTQFVANELGVLSMVNSPTFLVVKEHVLENTKNIKRLYHLDLYRLENEKQVEEIGLSDILKDKDGIFFIEWPEKGSAFLPNKTIKISFQYKDEHSREITIE